MSEENGKPKRSGGAQSFVLVVLSAILSATVLFLSMTAQCVYALRAEVSEMKSDTRSNAENIRDLQRYGSPIVQGINARLDALAAGQERIERILDQHTREGPSLFRSKPNIQSQERTRQ